MRSLLRITIHNKYNWRQSQINLNVKINPTPKFCDQQEHRVVHITRDKSSMLAFKRSSITIDINHNGTIAMGDDDAILYNAVAKFEHLLDDANDEILYNAITEFEQLLVRGTDNRTPSPGSFFDVLYIYSIVKIYLSFCNCILKLIKCVSNLSFYTVFCS